jgi:hypothetical protein
MTRFAAVGIVVIVLGVGGWLVYWFMNQPQSAGPIAGEAGRAAHVEEHHSAMMPGKPAELAIATDDREPERKAYFDSLNARIQDVIVGKAPEKSLPTPALPILQARLNDGKLDAATTRPIGEALAADSVRLRNGLRMQKEREWYQTNLLDVFERDNKGKPWEKPARVAVEAAVRDWSGDVMYSGDEPMIRWREGQAAGSLDPDDALFTYVAAQTVRDLDGQET